MPVFLSIRLCRRPNWSGAAVRAEIASSTLRLDGLPGRGPALTGSATEPSGRLNDTARVPRVKRSETAPGIGVLRKPGIAHAGTVRLTLAVQARNRRIVVAGLICADLADGANRRPAATSTDQAAVRGSLGARTAATDLGTAGDAERRRCAANQLAIDSAPSPTASSAGERALDRIEGPGRAGAAAAAQHRTSTALDAVDGTEALNGCAIGRAGTTARATTCSAAHAGPASRTGPCGAAALSRVRFSCAARRATESQEREQGKRQGGAGSRIHDHPIAQSSSIGAGRPGAAVRAPACPYLTGTRAVRPTAP
jgi:hypothetical protein